MKKWLFVAVLGLLLFSACANDPKAPVDLNSFLIREGIALTCDIDQLAESKEYLELMTAPGAITQIAAQMGAEDYRTPENAYLLKLPDDFIIRATGAELQTTIPEDIKEKIASKINGSVLASLVNATFDQQTLVASSVTAWQKSYRQPSGWSESMVLLLEYEGAFSSVVSFAQSGEGVITGVSAFVKTGEKDLLSVMQVYLNTPEAEIVHLSSVQLEEILSKPN